MSRQSSSTSIVIGRSGSGDVRDELRWNNVGLAIFGDLARRQVLMMCGSRSAFKHGGRLVVCGEKSRTHLDQTVFAYEDPITRADMDLRTPLRATITSGVVVAMYSQLTPVLPYEKRVMAHCAV